MKRNPIYDIRTSADALCTLVNFTGVAPPIWEQYIEHRSEYVYDEDLVEDVISKNGTLPKNYEEWLFIFFHITTSANDCKSIKKYGILDLKEAYRCKESELRLFLDNKGILIDIDEETLSYNNRTYDISRSRRPSQFDKVDYASWCIGNKLFYDYTICGFLSVWHKAPYGGGVHCRPEILNDIDNLLGLSLSEEWHLTHKAYEITAIIKGEDMLYNGNDENTSKDKIIDYMTRAFNAAFGLPSEEIVLLKNNVQVLPERIVEVEPLRYW